MSDERSAERRKSWRKSTRAQPTRTPAASFGTQARQRRRLVFRVSALGTLAIGLSVILWLVLSKGPIRDVPLIVVSVTQNSPAGDTVFGPANEFALEDVGMLESRFQKTENESRNRTVGFEGTEGSSSGPMPSTGNVLIDRATSPLSPKSKLRGGGPDGNMFAIVVTARGLVDKGSAYLLVGDSRPNDPSTWVKLEDLFAGIAEKLAERKSGGAVADRVVLFLDATRGPDLWDWGLVGHTFANRCRTLAGQFVDEGLAVVLASGEGQRSWVDPRRGRGLFTSAVALSLSGSGDEDGDGTITLGEVERFTKNQVAAQAKTIWAAEQIPELVTPEAADWPVIKQYPDTTPLPENLVEMDGIREDLDRQGELWKRHQQLSGRRQSPVTTDPVTWAAIEKRLARLADLILAGRGYQEERRRLGKECDKWLRGLENGGPSAPSKDALSEWALVNHFDFRGATELDEADRAFEMSWSNAKPEERVSIPMPPGMNNTQRESLVMKVVLPWLLRNGADAQALSTVGDLLGRNQIGTPELPQYLETHLLRLMSANDLPLVQSPTSARADRILKSHQASRRVMLTDDERALFWLRPDWRTAETRRLRLVDSLLAAEQPGLDEESLDGLLRGEFATLESHGQVVSSAFQLRDVALHRIPRLAETLLADWEPFQAQERRDPTTDLLRRATEATRCLVESLRLTPLGTDDRPIEASARPAWLTQVRLKSADTQTALASLEGRLKDRIDDVTQEKAADASGLRRLVALRRGSGAVSPELQESLSRRLEDLLRQKPIGFVATAPKPSAIADTSASMVLPAWLQIDGQHPALAWANATQELKCASEPAASAIAPKESTGVTESTAVVESTGANVPSWSEDQGTRMRGWVGLAESTGSDEARKIAFTRSRQGEPIDVVRQPLDDLDAQSRTLTFWIHDQPERLQRIASDRAALDRRLFMLEHAETMRREFWCEARSGERPFFHAAARRSLRAGPSSFAAVETIIDGVRLTERLDQALLAATARPTLAMTPAGDRRNGVLLEEVRGQSITFAASRPSAVPPGRVAVRLAVFDQPWGLDGDDAKAAGEPLTISVLIPENLSANRGNVPVATFFRGLRREGKLSIQVMGDPQTVTFELPRYDAPTAVVSGKADASPTIVFVVDSSSSMGKTLGRPTRLAVAQQRLKSFLTLLFEKRAQVGLVLFGHRYGWDQGINDNGPFQRSPTDPDRFIVKTGGRAAGGPVALDLFEQDPRNPNFDVEKVATVKLLAGAHLDELNRKIENLVPVGVTPTYRAISAAYELLNQKSGEIIVLTDDQPFLAHIPDTQGKSERDREQDKFIRQIQQQHQANDAVQLTIINFANQKGQGELTDKLKFASPIVRDAKNEDALEKALAVSLGSTDVSWRNNGQQASRTGELDNFVAVENWPPPGTRPGQPVRPPVQYSLHVQKSNEPSPATTTLTVEGGEAFELQRIGSRLQHTPFPRGGARLMELAGDAKGRFSVTALNANLANNRELTLPLVIESVPATSFTPRPQHVWVDLVGFDRTRERQIAHSVSLLEFDSGRPVPVLLCRVADWPAWASEVEVNAYLKFDSRQLPTFNLPRGINEKTSLEGLAGLQWTITEDESDGYELKITQVQTDGKPPVAVHVEPNPLPQSAVTRRYPDALRVEWVMWYDARPTELELTVVTAASLRQSATLHAQGVVTVED